MLIREAVSYAKSHGVSPENAVYIVSKITRKDAASIYTHPDNPLDKDEEEVFMSVISRHINDLKPLAYIFGEAHFYGLVFYSDERALIPRVETELIIEEAVKIIEKSKFSLLSILDMCTGSGIIPVTLAKLFPHATVFASDISEEALELAASNAKRHGCAVKFILSDLFSAIPKRKFSIITVNPPYIGLAEQDMVDESVLRHEPHMALFSGDDGLGIIKKILAEAPAYLEERGCLIMEINSNQGQKVLELATQAGYNARIKKDLTGMDRFVIATV